MKSNENVTAIARAYFRAALVTSTIIFTGFNSNAQLSKVPLAQRVEYSDLIIEGKVTARRSFWNPDHTMIYTGNTVEIFKIFKGTVAASSIEILTEGGTVGESMIKVDPSLSLGIGDIGIFTCEHVKRFKLGRQKAALPQYEVYSSVQGFVQYDLQTETARDVFSNYNDIENELYKRLLPKGTGSYRTVKNFHIHDSNRPSVLVTGFLAATLTANGYEGILAAIGTQGLSFFVGITSFSPTTVSAGTGSTITITGTAFGATQGSGFVGFRNAEDGGATFVTPLASQYVSWSNTQIVVAVPSTAGTGTIQVTQGTTVTSSSSLTITFSHQNVEFDPGSGTIAYQTDLVNDNGTGGYTLRMNTGFDANASAKASLLRALESWRCSSGANWTIGTTTSVSNAVSDGTNAITFDNANPLSAGVLGVGYSYWSGCASGPNILWYVNEIDLILDEGSNINPLTWEYGPSAPSGSEYDFESFCLREMGRLYQLGYVNDPSSVMHYGFVNGVSHRTLSANDLAGAAFVQAKSVVANVCGPGAVTAYSCNSAPTDIALSSASVNENVAVNTVVGTLSSTDPDAANTFTYSLVAGTGDADNTSFNINGNELRLSVSPDFETKSSYTVRIRSADQGGLSFEKAFAVTITNVNEAPTDLSLSASAVSENVAANTVVGTLTSTDPDAANTFTYTLVTGTGDTDNASFNISGSGLRITSSPDFEIKSSYTVRVRTADQGSLLFEKAFAITINNVNEAPTNVILSASAVDENVAANTVVGTLSTADPDATNTFTYTLVTGTGDTDNASFNISGGSLRITNSPDFEIKSSYTIRVRTADQGSLLFEKAFAITIINVNEAPTDIILSASSISENVAANTVVGTLSTTDPDATNTFTYTLVVGTGDTDNASFNISGNGLRITASPDFEIKNSYTVRVRTSDQGSLLFEKAFAITINNVNEAPTDLSLSASTVIDGVAPNTVVGILSATDPDAGNTVTYSLVAGAGDSDNASFNISGTNLRISVSPDFGTKNSYTVRLRTADQGGLSFEKAFTIAVTNVNKAPTDLSLSISAVIEGVAPNTVVGALSTTDPDADNTFTYTLVAGAGGTDNASFNVIGSNLRISVSPDFETKSSYTVRVRTTDQGGLFYEEALTITIANANEAPTDLSLSASTVMEGAAANTVVGVLSTTDPDAGNTFTYSLVAGAGDTDNASFNINAGNLRISASPDFETKASYTTRVRTTDQGGLSYEKAFTIGITNVKEAPTDLSLSASSVDENTAPNTVVGTLSTTDPTTPNAFTYSLAAGAGDTDNPSFNISGSNLRISISPDFETRSSYTVRIRTTNQDGLFYEEALIIAINDLVEAIEINNFMSPNGDGKNDHWEIRGNLSFSGCDVKILDRFGSTVYKSSGYDNTWDGTLNGRDLPVGVYYYVISCGGSDSVTGDITLTR